MYPIILEYKDAIDSEDLNIMLEICNNASEADWSKMNNLAETGEFWLGKRMLIEDHVIPSWHEKIVSLRTEIDFTNISEPRKVQRFKSGESLGPLTDAKHVPELRHGSILFLNSQPGAEIVFPKLNYKVAAEANKFVVYPANQEYIIRGSETSDYLYFSTVFMS